MLKFCLNLDISYKKNLHLFVISFVEPKMNWFEADDYCKGEGGKLVEIESEEENTALVEVI